jgi:gamma-glutamylcyclotransferase (GGCT)/AIG2-like uncharacterized protein YtfP|tara:strand:- start:410 stop:874 length:465 start_codon:yes stop_codon:yes gene_type:complete
MPYLFSYGSNNITQLTERLNRKIYTTDIIPAYLDNYIRIFCFHSTKWNGSVASIYPKKNKLVFGTVISLTEKELRKLDKFETNYKRKIIKVYDNHFNKMTVQTYICNDTKFVKYPSKEYLDQIKQNIYESWKIKTKYIPIYIKTKLGIELYKNE